MSELPRGIRGLGASGATLLLLVFASGCQTGPLEAERGIRSVSGSALSGSALSGSASDLGRARFAVRRLSMAPPVIPSTHRLTTAPVRLGPLPAAGQSGPAPATAAPGTGSSGGNGSGGGDLASRATDPTASPLSFSLIAQVTPDFYDLAGGAAQGPTQTVLKFQPVIPFKAWCLDHILRLTLPYQTGGPGEEGLGDVAIFDLAILPQRWGRLGLGAVASFSAGTRDVDAHAAAGPAVGFVAVITKDLNVGLFNQNLFSSEVKISQFQPIVAYQLGDGWSLSAGDLQWIYDWDRGEFVSMPVGFQLGKVVQVAGQPMRFAVNPQYNLRDLPGAPRTSVIFTATLLLP